MTSNRAASPIIIRLATATDLPAINDIYNHYVVHSAATYQEEPEPIVGREAWFAKHGPAHPVIVAVDASGAREEVVGWGSLSAFHPRSAYRFTAENSVYLRHDRLGRGVGSLLLADLISRATSIGHHSLLALIDADQPASVALHRKFGFEQVGRLKEVGFKFDQWRDVVYLQKRLGTAQ